MTRIVPSAGRFLAALAFFAVLLLVTPSAEAQGVGFQGGFTVDPEQAFVGSHFETGEIFRGLRLRPGVDGSFGSGFSLATINIEILYHLDVGRSWSLYQGGGPAIVFMRQNDDTSTHAGSFVTFGFAHENGFFTDFRFGGGHHATLKFTAGYTVRKRKP